jgi:TolB protein
MKIRYIFFLYTLIFPALCLAIGPYTNNGAAIYDQATGLTWMQKTADTNNNGSITLDDALNWQDALAYCEGLELSGYSDWRVPNIRELKSLVDHRTSLAAVLDPIFQYETAYAACYYWSSTTNRASYTNDARVVCFGNGVPDQRDKVNDKSYVCCVRGGLSPANQKTNEIVYASRKDGNEEIYSISLAGSNEKNLTNSSSSTDGTPSYSPDRKNIVFASNRTGNFDLYIMPAEGSSSPVNITNNPNDDGWPSWSPKGDKILFLSNRDDDKVNHNVYTTDTDGKNVSRITFGYNVAHAVWSPDANQIAFASNGEIYIVKLSTGVVTQLTNNSWYDDYPSWSPDGEYLVYASAKSSSNDNVLDLFMINIASKTFNTIFDNDLDIRYPAWLPDGRVVFAMANEYGFGENQNSTREIYITKNAVQFNSILTVGDIARLTFNDVEENHPNVAMSARKIPIPNIIAPILLNN